MYQETIPVSLKTSDIKKPNFPNQTLKNPLKKGIFVNAIQLILDAYFIANGSLIIKSYNQEIFNSIDQDLLQSRNIPLTFENLLLPQGRSINFFFWNKITNELIEISGIAYVTFSENPKLTVNTIQPANVNDLLNEKSQPVTLFTQSNYANETVTQLIDMKGYQKMILLIGGSNLALPTILIGTNPIADGDLNTSMNYNPTQTKTVRASVDFGSIASRVPASKVGFTPAIDDCNTFFLEVSSDNVNWSQVATWQRCSSPSTFTMIGAEQSFRYMRVQDQGTPQGSWQTANNALIYELYDANTIGGTASISFEVLLDSTWIELVSASALGTITQGLSLSKIIGDVINDVATNKFNLALPSTQTNFRIKMIVSDHLNIGVSMIKV